MRVRANTAHLSAIVTSFPAETGNPAGQDVAGGILGQGWLKAQPDSGEKYGYEETGTVCRALPLSTIFSTRIITIIIATIIAENFKLYVVMNSSPDEYI